MEELEFALQEYVLTANDPKYNGDYSVINSKFPELADIDPFVLQEYVLTANDPKYGGDWGIINGKFNKSELFLSSEFETKKYESNSETDVEEEKEPIETEIFVSKGNKEVTAKDMSLSEIQAEYEMLLSTIEKARAERMQAQMFMAQQYADQKEGGVASDSEEAKAFKEAMETAAANME